MRKDDPISYLSVQLKWVIVITIIDLVRESCEWSIRDKDMYPDCSVLRWPANERYHHDVVAWYTCAWQRMKMITVLHARNLTHRIGKKFCKKRSIVLLVLTDDETTRIMLFQVCWKCAIDCYSSLRVQQCEWLRSA